MCQLNCCCGGVYPVCILIQTRSFFLYLLICLLLGIQGSPPVLFRGARGFWTSVFNLKSESVHYIEGFQSLGKHSFPCEQKRCLSPQLRFSNELITMPWWTTVKSFVVSPVGKPDRDTTNARWAIRLIRWKSSIWSNNPGFIYSFSVLTLYTNMQNQSSAKYQSFSAPPLHTSFNDINFHSSFLQLCRKQNNDGRERWSGWRDKVRYQ